MLGDKFFFLPQLYPNICICPATPPCVCVFCTSQSSSCLTNCNFSLFRYEFGSAIFIAWAGAFLVVVGGAMLAASCPRSKSSSSPKYPISRPPSSKEYVWTGQDSVRLKEHFDIHNSLSSEIETLKRCISEGHQCLSVFFFFFLILYFSFVRATLYCYCNIILTIAFKF